MTEPIDTHCLIFNTKGILLEDIIAALDDIYGEPSELQKHLVESLIKTDHECVFTGSFEDCKINRNKSIERNVACYVRAIDMELFDLTEFVNGV